jgi:hypothetical protein
MEDSGMSSFTSWSHFDLYNQPIEPNLGVIAFPSWTRFELREESDAPTASAPSFPSWRRFELADDEFEPGTAMAASPSWDRYELVDERTSRRGEFGARWNVGLRWIAIATLAMIGFGSLAAQADEIARGDAAWARRAEGERAGRPQPEPILEAVDSYTSAVEARPENLEARWKLLRALHFAGDFAAQDPQEKHELFERARDVSEQGLVLLADRVGAEVRLDEMDPPDVSRNLDAADLPPSDVARLYFWSAINWGSWSRGAGMLTAVRRGVANRIHRYALVTAELEPEYEEGGVFRLLGSLHAGLPRVPFVSPWVDRDQSIALLERAYAMAPAHPGNGLLLATTLLELAPSRRAEAVGLLQQIDTLPRRREMHIEDLAIRKQARESLDAAQLEEST